MFDCLLRPASEVFAGATHVLAKMFATPHDAAVKLQKLNFITYSRGRLKVLDRAGLEATSCGCYEIIKKQSDRVPG